MVWHPYPQADAIMLARGALGLAIPAEKVPLAQAKITTKCKVRPPASATLFICWVTFTKMRCEITYRSLCLLVCDNGYYTHDLN